MKLLSFSLKEIENRFKSENDVNIKERLQIILHIREGYTERDIAGIVRVSKGKISFWKKRFELESFHGLYDKKGRGRKAELSEEELSMMASSLAEGYRMENGYTRPYKTKDVIKFIRDNFEINYTLRHVRRILKNMG